MEDTEYWHPLNPLIKLEHGTRPLSIPAGQGREGQLERLNTFPRNAPRKGFCCWRRGGRKEQLKNPLRAHSQPLASCHSGLASRNALFVTGSFLQTQHPDLKAAFSLPPAHPRSIQPPPMGQAGPGTMENGHLWAGVLLCSPTPQHWAERAGSSNSCTALSSIDSFSLAPGSLSCHCGAPGPAQPTHGPAGRAARDRECSSVPFPVPPELAQLLLWHRRSWAADVTQRQWLQLMSPKGHDPRLAPRW